MEFPCHVFLCRKTLDKHGVRWCAHDGDKWVDSVLCIPIPSRSTNKQKRMLGFKV
jgi:hypothetical protein